MSDTDGPQDIQATARYQAYRTSYLKTTLLASGLAIVAGAVAGTSLLLIDDRLIPGLAGLLCMVLVAIAASGFLVLHRHSREQAGKPDLFWSLLEELEEQPPDGLLRRIIGPRLRAGSTVRVRSPADIGRTLDEHGDTDGIPFMPEMLQYCGRRFTVHRVVDKINDWTGRTGTGLRRLRGFVTLRGIRCDGSGHGDCHADCHILWHESWLASVDDVPPGAEDAAAVKGFCQSIRSHAVRSADGAECYRCQITELVRASTKMRAWDFRQDIRPLVYGNVDSRAFLVAMLTRLFNRIQRIRGGMSYPMMPAQLRSGPTPTCDLGLQPGEKVRALSKSEIGKTLHRNKNRGLWFGAETMRLCGQHYTVRNRVERFLDENTGEMVTPKSPFIVLEAATATGEFLRFCPQNEYVYWREVWLRRLSEN